MQKRFVWNFITTETSFTDVGWRKYWQDIQTVAQTMVTDPQSLCFSGEQEENTVNTIIEKQKINRKLAIEIKSNILKKDSKHKKRVQQ